MIASDEAIKTMLTSHDFYDVRFNPNGKGVPNFGGLPVSSKAVATLRELLPQTASRDSKGSTCVRFEVCNHPVLTSTAKWNSGKPTFNFQ